MRELTIIITTRFNSRTPGGVRQDVPSDDDVDFPVSIHAPREGCDLFLILITQVSVCFNSRTPGGVRQKA